MNFEENPPSYTLVDLIFCCSTPSLLAFDLRATGLPRGRLVLTGWVLVEPAGRARSSVCGGVVLLVTWSQLTFLYRRPITPHLSSANCAKHGMVNACWEKVWFLTPVLSADHAIAHFRALAVYDFLRCILFLTLTCKKADLERSKWTISPQHLGTKAHMPQWIIAIFPHTEKNQRELGAIQINGDSELRREQYKHSPSLVVGARTMVNYPDHHGSVGVFTDIASTSHQSLSISICKVYRVARNLVACPVQQTNK